MQCGYYETINNTAYFYETVFNIVVIVGQLSNYNSMLKVKEYARKDEEHVIKPKLRAKSNGHVRNKVNNNKLNK